MAFSRRILMLLVSGRANSTARGHTALTATKRPPTSHATVAGFGQSPVIISRCRLYRHYYSRISVTCQPYYMSSASMPSPRIFTAMESSWRRLFGRKGGECIRMPVAHSKPQYFGARRFLEKLLSLADMRTLLASAKMACMQRLVPFATKNRGGMPS